MVINGDPKGKNMLYCNGNSVIIRDIEVSICLSHSPATSWPHYRDALGCRYSGVK